MSPRIDFYLLQQTTFETGGTLICRIIAKAYLQQQRMLVNCANANDMAFLDKLLWTYQDISFLPHVCAPQPEATQTPIVLGLSGQLAQSPSTPLLINLTSLMPPAADAFQRIAEIVPNETAARQAARERYRHYRAQGWELHSHTLN